MHRLVLGAAAAACLAADPACAASIEFRELVARVTVVPEARDDIQVEVLTRNPHLPIHVTGEGAKRLVDGDLARRIKDCRVEDGRQIVHVAGLGDVDWAQMPQLVVRTPRAVQISAGGAVFGAVGRSSSLDLAQAGCGDWTAANVDGPVKVSLAGSGDVRLGTSRGGRLRLTGSGDIQAGAVHGDLDAEVGGSGDISAASVAGALKVEVVGSGDVHVAAGRASPMKAVIAGSGDVTFGGAAESLSARITGSGVVSVRRATGPVERRILGSGSVKIGGN
jgi:hypothetical protein